MMSRLFLPSAVLTIFQLMDASLGRVQVDQFYQTIVMHIISRVPNTPTALEIHCHSEKIDLGLYPLNNGDDLVWKFDQSIFLKTVYTCDFFWTSKHQVFDVYNSDVGGCFVGVGMDESCYWEARTDGFYFSNDNQSWQKKNDWP